MDLAVSTSRRIDRHRLRAIREEQGVSRDRLAGAAGVASRTVAAIESGEAEPRAATVTVLAMALGVEVDALTHDDLAGGGEAVKDEPVETAHATG